MVMPTERVDLRKRLKALYSASATPVVIDVPVLTCLMVDGHGDPNISPDYAAAVAVLFGISYTLKFRFKRAAEPVDFAVMPLEGLWWADDPQSFVRGDKAKWRWTTMIVQPEYAIKPQKDWHQCARLQEHSDVRELLFDPRQ
jgi:hypothetical protein